MKKEYRWTEQLKVNYITLAVSIYVKLYIDYFLVHHTWIAWTHQPNCALGFASSQLHCALGLRRIPL